MFPNFRLNFEYTFPFSAYVQLSFSFHVSIEAFAAAGTVVVHSTVFPTCNYNNQTTLNGNKCERERETI